MEDGDEAVVIDPGCEAAEQILEVLGNRARITAILLTHNHSDHTRALTDLAEETGAPVFIHPADKETVEKGWIVLKNIRKTGDEVILPTRPLVDGDTLNFGEIKIGVIETPGHTPGSCCFLVDGHLFSGDTLFHKNVGRTDLAGGNEDQLKNSLKKLLGLNPNTVVHPGHDEDWSIGEAQKFNHFPI
ncbi:MAG: MBL fold metallo-hydrolase [Candidatus Peribacteraceae bacterium]|nr:MBL fold metallo-hydrolase [Candidatus Peribacteraceae bacterium]